MYIIKNAIRSVTRSKGRNILIGIIVLVIAVSACLGLSIRQASESAKKNTLEGMSITAQISYDRSSMMSNMGGGKGSGKGNKGGFDRNQFADMLGSASSLTLEEYQKYSEAEAVQDFYYTLTVYFNGSDSFSPVSDEVEEDDEAEEEASDKSSGGGMSFPGGMGGMMPGGIFNSGDFTVVGYSSDTSMTDFVNGVASIVEGGSMFEEGTTEYECVISEELAIYNNLSVGDKITVTNPSLESESYKLKITGLYTSTSTNDFSMSMFGASQDPANRIYMSANALDKILAASEKASKTVTDENTGREKESAMSSNLSAIYLLPDVDAYYAFEEQVRTLGLDEAYAVSSTDLTAYENSLAPLNTLSTMAGWFLIVILAIGAVILVVLNIFNIRERKYEVGVLTAMGMKKWKVAAQFICEILVVTMIAVILGAGIGAVSSVPVTNALLEGQLESQSSMQSQFESSFGRPGSMPGGMPGGMGGGMNFPGAPSDMPSDVPDDVPGGFKDKFSGMFSDATDYITEVDSAMNLTVVMQMIAIGLLLTLIASAASVLFIMRYDPLKILANRD